MATAEPLPNRIRLWRKRRALTLERLAKQLGTSAGHLHKWETGKVGITLDRLGEVARALGCHVVDLIEQEATVPVVGIVGAGTEVRFLDFPIGHHHATARCPPGLDPANSYAIEVVDDAMQPIDNGWLLFYSALGGVQPECFGKLCVVKLAGDGATYVKRLKPAHTPGLYNLYGVLSREMEDQAVEWAAPVLFARPAEEGELD